MRNVCAKVLTIGLVVLAASPAFAQSRAAAKAVPAAVAASR